MHRHYVNVDPLSSTYPPSWASHKIHLTDSARTQRFAPPLYWGSVRLWSHICHDSSPWYVLSTLVQQTSRICPSDYIIIEPKHKMWTSTMPYDARQFPLPFWCGNILRCHVQSFFRSLPPLKHVNPFLTLLLVGPPSIMGVTWVWKQTYNISQIRWELN